MKDERLNHSWWCDYCDMRNSDECKVCKPPRIREGYENKKPSKNSVVPPSEWIEP